LSKVIAVLDTSPVVLITGAAQRIGATIARRLHQLGFNVVIHYCKSKTAAQRLRDELNALRTGSAVCIAADLTILTTLASLVEQTLTAFQRIDVLINNAASFYPTELPLATEQQWDSLFAHNAKGAFFLSQYAAKALTQANGQIINITDIHAQQPLTHYAIYCAAKAALAQLTRALATELAPVRVNSIAPGAMLWPEGAATMTVEAQQQCLANIPMGKLGSAEAVSATVEFLVCHGAYITGQTIHVDGGRRLVDQQIQLNSI
jgi:pteridine reductase